ncbi:nucleoside hydrolase [bacterium LRH843]|nr:nucleoside hydrolase [bacterium LRH843]
MKKKIILDVDTGVDDALGIILAVKSGQFDIAGITTTHGNVSLDTATLNTCKILEFLNADIPVIKGAAKPVKRSTFFEHAVHGSDGLGGALADMDVSKQPDQGFAVDFLIRQVLQDPGNITLIMTGPLTNLALAVQNCPEIVSKVKEVIFMGGVVNGVGNITPVAEYNMYVDPEAAKIVFHAGFESLIQVGLDVTRKALLTEQHIESITDPRMKEYVKESTADYTKRYFERNGVKACAMHDPLAVGVALERELVGTKAYHVDIETNSDLCDGQTVCDFQNRLGKAPTMHVCETVDHEAFFRLFIAALNGQ